MKFVTNHESNELEIRIDEGTGILKTTEKQNSMSLGNYKLNRPIRILAIASSMRENSYSTLTAKIALDLANQKYGAQTELLDLRQTKMQTYNPENSSECNTNVLYLVKWADAYLLASPDYHGSMSGAMKNFLDHFWAEFAGKLFGFICASHEKGLTAMDQMRTAVRQCYAWSMPYGISIDGEKDFNDRSEIIKSSLNNKLRMFARDLAAYGGLIRGQFLGDLVDENLVETFARRYKSFFIEQKPLIT